MQYPNTWFIQEEVGSSYYFITLGSDKSPEYRGPGKLHPAYISISITVQDFDQELELTKVDYQYPTSYNDSQPTLVEDIILGNLQGKKIYNTDSPHSYTLLFSNGHLLYHIGISEQRFHYKDQMKEGEGLLVGDDQVNYKSTIDQILSTFKFIK